MKRSLLSLSIALLLLLTVACSGGKNPTPSETFQLYLKALSEGNLEEAGKYVEGGIQMADGMEALYQEASKFYSAFQAEILKETIDGDKAILAIELTIPDQEQLSGQVFSKLSEEGISLDVLDESVIEKIVDVVKTINYATIDTITEPDELTMVKKDGQWLIPQQYDLSGSIVYTFFP